LQKWKQNLETFFAFQLPHLSAYALTVEPRTALSTLISKGKMQGIDDKATVSHFQLLLEKTKHKGYVHYEISNFALPGHYSKHNSIYWMGGHYLGLGPSAHSFNGSSRQWNVSNMKQYVESDKLENRVMEKEILTVDQQYNEYVMTSLRTSWGCDTEHIQNSFGERYVNYLSRSIQAFVDEQKVRKDGHIYFLTDSGKLFADGIAASLFI
jgi:oxygen-independent coproporphyrinogen-3 oxidase